MRLLAVVFVALMGSTNACYNVMKSTYAAGGDLGVLTNVSTDACWDACARDRECGAANYRTDTRQCRLRPGDNLRDGDSKVSALVSCRDRNVGSTVDDFIHRAAIIRNDSLMIDYETVCADDMDTWEECVEECISAYGDDCLYVQFDQLTRCNTCIISRPCSTPILAGACSRISDVDKTGKDYNRVNCKHPDYRKLQARIDPGKAACQRT